MKVARATSLWHEMKILTCLSDKHGTVVAICDYALFQGGGCLGEAVSEARQGASVRHPLRQREVPH